MKTIGRICLLFFLLSCCGKCWAEPSYQGKTLSAWLDDYGAGPKNYKPSPQANEALRQIGPEAVPYLLELLHKTNTPAVDDELQQIGAGTLNGTNTSNFIPASWFHWKAYLGFQALGSGGKSAIQDLARLARDNPEETSYFPNIGDMKSVKLIAELADNSSSFVTLGSGAGFHGSEVLRNTKPFLFDGEIAAWSLAAIGKDAVPSLIVLLNDPNPHLKQRAVEALGMVGPSAEPAVQEIVNLLTDPAINVSRLAADALGHINKRPDIVIPALIAALSDSDIGVRCSAAHSLGLFGIRATNSVPALLTSFADSDYRIREDASTALGKISPEITAKQVVPSLLHQLDDPNSSRNGALIDLLQLNLEPDVMIPHLIKALDDSDANDKSIQMNAIRGLGKYGSAANAVVPKLTRMLADENPFVRQDATNALDKIEPAWRTSH
jgi:HEAT repeat protein